MHFIAKAIKVLHAIHCNRMLHVYKIFKITRVSFFGTQCSCFTLQYPFLPEAHYVTECHRACWCAVTFHSAYRKHNIVGIQLWKDRHRSCVPTYKD